MQGLVAGAPAVFGYTVRSHASARRPASRGTSRMASCRRAGVLVMASQDNNTLTEKEKALNELAAARANLRKDLHDSQAKWAKEQAASGGVAAEGVETAAAPAPIATLPEIELLNQDTFYPALAGAGANLVVVDFYTDWCGPCKLMYPRLQEFQQKYKSQGVVFFKFNCNKENKDLGKKLEIKVAPTFHLYRNSERVAMMTGAKVDELNALIEQHK